MLARDGLFPYISLLLWGGVPGGGDPFKFGVSPVFLGFDFLLVLKAMLISMNVCDHLWVVR